MGHEEFWPVTGEGIRAARRRRVGVDQSQEERSPNHDDDEQKEKPPTAPRVVAHPVILVRR